MNRCDVVIVNFNAGVFLRDAVESALRSGLVANIYVVDNASTDGSLALLPSEHDSQIIIIRNTTNVGFAAACNIGLMRSAAENVLVLNPDCLMMVSVIDHLISALRSADRIGMAGPLVLNADDS